jgi:DedD protein
MPSHDPEIYKDKIEVSLDGRQIFYLFFGGSVIVGLVFVLGVLVGRRVEARGHLDRADTQAVSDPLAALDRLERTDQLSFRGTLTGAQAPTDVEKAIGELEKRRTPGAAVKPENAPPASAAAPAEKPAAAAAEKPQPAARPEAVTHPDADRAKAEKADKADKADKHDGDKHDGDKHDGDKHDGDRHDGDKKARKHEDGGSEAKKPAGRSEPVTRPEVRSDARSEPKAEARAEAGDAKVRFTLQLSSFQDRSEAETFLGAMKSAGFQPYLTEAEVTGKGTFYRVRLGSYRSLEAANDAKAEYEKTARKSAQVMRL